MTSGCYGPWPVYIADPSRYSIYYTTNTNKIEMKKEQPVTDTPEQTQERRESLAEIARLNDLLEKYESKPTFTDLTMRLARSTARGVRQLELINEFLAGGTVMVVEYQIPGRPHLVSARYGKSRTEHSSWKALKLRLLENGFYFEYEGVEGLKMKFSG